MINQCAECIIYSWKCRNLYILLLELSYPWYLDGLIPCVMLCVTQIVLCAVSLFSVIGGKTQACLNTSFIGT